MARPCEKVDVVARGGLRLEWRQSDLHPHALSLEGPDTSADFKADLRADLDVLPPPPIIHRYRCIVAEGCGTDALTANGFQPTRMTRIYDLPVGMCEHPSLSAPLSDAVAAHWFRRNERAPWDQWVAAHWRHYTAVHVGNPPRKPSRAGLRRIFIADDLVEGLALRDGPHGRVHGFASLRDGSDIGWIGAADGVVGPTLGLCLRRAAALGWTMAALEVDDDDHPLWALAQGLGVAAAKTYVTWQLERDQPQAVH